MTHPVRSNLLLLLALTLVASGCTASLTSDHNVVNVQFPDAQDLDNDTRLIAEGTSLCPDTLTDVATNATVTACYVIEADNAWQTAGACYTAATPGPAVLSLTAQACTVNDAAFTAADDTLTVEVVGETEIDARLQWLEEVANDPSLTLTTPVPTDTVPADGAPIHVATGATMLLAPELRRASDDAIVGWTAVGASAQVAGDGVQVSPAADDESDIQIVVAAGADATVTWTLASGATWPLADVVADDGPYTLDQVYAAVLEDTDGYSAPLGARAVIRNAAGDVVFGSDVTWTSDLLHLAPGVENSMPSSDYVGISDDCRDPNTLSGEQHASLTATMPDGATSRIDIVWTPAPGDGTAWTAPPQCLDDTGNGTGEPDCGCASTTGGSIGALALVAVLASARRRRTF